MKTVAAILAAVDLPESRVVEMWQVCLAGRTDLATEDGQPLKIVYPGRRNDDRGADLCDAVIATGGNLHRGDIEVHVKSSSWWGHRHHENPLYNRVVLHVVYQHDMPRAVVLENGDEVPTLVLQKFVPYPWAGTALAGRAMPCQGTAGRREDDFIGKTLDIAGDRRFYHRTAEMQGELSHEEPGQALYRGMMGALGYTKNKLPMMELACHMPLHRLAASTSGKDSGEENLVRYQALLLGAAGLLPSQGAEQPRGRPPPDEWAAHLEDAWSSQGGKAAMCPGDWQTFKVRPGNLPRRRIAAMSYLLYRYHPDGLLPVMARELENPAPDREPAVWLQIGAEDYWGKNIDFGLPAQQAAPALLGKDRADIIVINVLLPFAAARGPAAPFPGLAEKALELYRRWPALAENAVEKHMRHQLGISRGMVNSARRQQGIIHIYKTLCIQGKCSSCPLN